MTARTTQATRVWAAIRRLAFDGEVAERMAVLSQATRLSPGLIKALVRLDQQDYPSMRQFARQAMGCDPSYVTGLVDELTERGLAQRRANAQDRRVKTIVLTDQGKAVAARIQAAMAVPPTSLSVLGTTELAQLDQLLHLVTEDPSVRQAAG